MISYLRNFYKIHRRKFLIFFTITLTLVALLNIYFIVDVNARSNDECLWMPFKNEKGEIEIIFDLVKVGGVTWDAGIRNGDRLVAINEIKVKSPLHAQSILDQVESGEYAIYEVSRDGDRFTTKVYIKKLIIFPNLAFALLGTIWLLISFIVIMAKPDGYVHRLFYRIGVALILYVTVVFLQTLSIDSPADATPGKVFSVLFVDNIYNIAGIYLPFLIVHFFWIYPKSFAITEKKKFKFVLYSIPAILFALVLVFKIIFIYPGGGPNYLYQYLAYSINGLLGLGLAIGWVSLLINYRRLKNANDKKPIFIILVAYTLGLASIFYNIAIANAIADSIFNSPELFMPIILIVLLPISFAYSIFKYQLMDVSVVIKNAIIYGMATISVAGIYFLIIYILGQRISMAIGTEYRGIIAGIVFVVFALVFQSTKDKFQDLLTKKFYPEQFAYQNILIKFSNEISTIVGLENILDSMTRTFADNLRLNDFGILLKSPDGEKFCLKRSVGIEENNFTIRNDENKIAQLIKEKIRTEKICAFDKHSFKEVFDSDADKLFEENIHTAIPLIIKSKVVGILIFGVKYSGSEFSGKDLDLLCAVANQAAVSIENARLYESEAIKLTLERDLENARRIQTSLLPKYIPKIPGLDLHGEMIPAMQVGGDYFDIIPASHDQIFIVVADVSGKGLSAALYMSKIQTIMRYLCLANRSPKEILTEANKLICESMERNWFITLSMGLFDLSKRKLTFSRAGHLPLFSLNGNGFEVFTPQGLGLGLETGELFSATLEEMEIELKNNCIYGFFSDGVTEAMNDKKEMYGVEKLSKSLENNKFKNSDQIISELLSDIGAYRNGEEQNDDITIVIAKT